MGVLTREGAKIMSFLVEVFHGSAVVCGAWCLLEFLAVKNMNGEEVGAQKLEKTGYGGKCTGGGMVWDLLAKLRSNHSRVAN